MNMTSVTSHRVPQKLHPLSLLAQLTGRHTTGNLRVYTQMASWLINIEEGKLTYASYSDRLFERLDHHLYRLSQRVPTLDSATRVQIRLMFEPKNESQSMPYADYQAICWLVHQESITPTQAETLISQLSQEALVTFLSLKAGNYQFSIEEDWEKLPKFCHLDLRLLVEYCHKQLGNQLNIDSSVKASQGQPVLPLKKTPSEFLNSPEFSRVNNTETADKKNHDNSQTFGRKKVYTVVCIDDSQTILDSIKLFLEGDTFSVVGINDPLKALMKIIRSKPDIILLDVEMPNLQGFELCSILRRHSDLKNIPIVMVTSRKGFIDKAKAKMVRSSGYLTKPFTQQDLLKMLFKHLE